MYQTGQNPRYALAGFSIFIALFFMLLPFSGFAAEKKPPANAVPVRVAVVEERVISEQTAIIGSTEPVRQSTVAAEISGRVEAFYVKAGDFVKKDSIAMTIGALKGKSEIRIHRGVLKTKSALFGRSFWARGYCVSTVDLDKHQIRQYVREQEKLQKDQDQTEFEFDTD